MRELVNRIFSIFNSIKNNEISLEQTTFFCISASGILMALIGIVGNMSLGFNFVTILVPLLNIVLDICCIAYSIVTKRWNGPALLVVFYAVFILFPFLWFSTGGVTGSTLPYVILAGFVVVIMLHGKLRIALLLLIPVMFCTFIFLEMLYPAIVVPYPDRDSQYIDLMIGLAVSFFITEGLAVIVLSRYRIAKLKAEDLVKQLERLSVTDPLTGIYNRRMLTSCLDEEMRKSYDDGHPLTLCLLDIDHFKKVNDDYGHLCGDHVLIMLTRVIGKCLGENDLLGRYGGEEFLIIFKEQSISQALATIEKFREAMTRAQWEHGQPLTVSCGVSEYRKGISYSEFVKYVDTHLYAAKEQGRNRVIHDGSARS